MTNSEQPILYPHTCKCGKTIEVVGASTECWCACGKKMQIITDDLKGMRLRKGMKQNKVAELLGVSKAYLSKIEHGIVRITPELSKKLTIIYA